MYTYRYKKLFEDIEERKNVNSIECKKKINKYNNIVVLEHVTGKNIKIDNHFHDWLEFSLVIEGEQEVLIGNKKYNICTGDFYMIDYNVIHGCTTYNYEVKKITMQIKRSYIKDLAPMFSSKNIYCRSMDIVSVEEYYNYKELVYLYEFMISLFYKDDDYSSLGFDGMLRIFLYTLLTNFMLSNDEFEKKVEKNNNHIQLILSYIHHHYNEELTLNRLSKELYLAPKYISKLIKKELDINFKEYITHIRLNHAVYEMLNTNNSLLDICLQCGFTSQKSFIECFKKEYKITPHKFRNEKKE